MELWFIFNYKRTPCSDKDRVTMHTRSHSWKDKGKKIGNVGTEKQKANHSWVSLDSIVWNFIVFLFVVFMPNVPMCIYMLFFFFFLE